MRPLRLVFLGPPGTGKGTQAARLARRYGFVALSSGHLLRGQAEAGTELGREAEPYMKAGTLVPDEIITGAVLAGIDKLPADQGFVLDGFPRTVPQAEALDRGLAEARRPVEAVLDFQMDDTLIVDRITGRRSCNKCGATYNLKFLPPTVADVCDACGGPLLQRADDREEVVVTRLETYRAQTAPLVAYFRDRHLLHTVDASAGADEVTSAVVAIVEPLGQGG